MALPTFTVNSIKKTKEAQPVNEYTERAEVAVVWVVRFDCSILTLKALALVYDNEGDARQWSEGKLYTLQEIGEKIPRI